MSRTGLMRGPLDLLMSIRRDRTLALSLSREES